MSNHLALEQLIEHHPQSITEREAEVIQKKWRSMSLTLRASEITGVIIFISMMLCLVLALTEVVTPKGALLGLGSTALGVGIARELANALIKRNLALWMDSRRELSPDEQLAVAEYIEDHPELQSVIEVWSLQAEKLSLIELGLLQEYMHASTSSADQIRAS